MEPHTASRVRTLALENAGDTRARRVNAILGQPRALRSVPVVVFAEVPRKTLAIDQPRA